MKRVAHQSTLAIMVSIMAILMTGIATLNAEEKGSTYGYGVGEREDLGAPE